MAPSPRPDMSLPHITLMLKPHACSTTCSANSAFFNHLSDTKACYYSDGFSLGIYLHTLVVLSFKRHVSVTRELRSAAKCDAFLVPARLVRT